MQPMGRTDSHFGVIGNNCKRLICNKIQDTEKIGCLLGYCANGSSQRIVGKFYGETFVCPFYLVLFFLSRPLRFFKKLKAVETVCARNPLERE